MAPGSGLELLASSQSSTDLPSASLLSLPAELQINILLECSAQDIATSLTVCQALNTLITASTLLTYRIHLGRLGYIDTRNMNEATWASAGGATGALGQLHGLVDRWHSLNWEEYKLNYPAWHVDTPAVLDDGILATMDEFNKELSFLELPKRTLTLEPPLTPRSWKFRMPDPCRGVAFDASVNLVVVLEEIAPDLLTPNTSDDTSTNPFGSQVLVPMRLRFITLATGEAHPDAPRNTLPCGRFPTTGGPCQVLLCGDLVSLLVVEGDFGEGILAVWRWTTGELIGHLRKSIGGGSACFMSKDTILVPSLRSESACELILYRIPRTQSELSPIAVFDLTGAHLETSNDDHYAHPRIFLNGGRPLVSSSLPLVTAPPSPFFPSDDASFINIQYELVIVGAETTIELHLPRSAFLRYAEHSPTTQDVRRIPWWEWGASRARWPHKSVTSTNTALYGARKAFFERKTRQITVVNLNSRLRGWTPEIPLPPGLIQGWSDGEHSSTSTYMAQRDLKSADRRERWVSKLLCDDHHVVLHTVSPESGSS
ncbi:hypothetical protein DL93DRAFT_816868 [Clavulina sp. PMI_390]|nr:hypothetical protein DL93DRAFT_816868 [Clavulina sp. PMI_390]